MRKLNNPIMCSCTKLEDGVGCGDSCLNRCFAKLTLDVYTLSNCTT